MHVMYSCMETPEVVEPFCQGVCVFFLQLGDMKRTESPLTIYIIDLISPSIWLLYYLSLVN